MYLTYPAFGGRGGRWLELVGFSSLKGLMQETPSSNGYVGRIEDRTISQLRRNGGDEDVHWPGRWRPNIESLVARPRIT